MEETGLLGDAPQTSHSKVMADVDTNKDGKLSEAEIAARLEKVSRAEKKLAMKKNVDISKEDKACSRPSPSLRAPNERCYGVYACAGRAAAGMPFT